MDWLVDQIESPDQHYLQLALERQLILTKPPGSLGMLEQLAVRLAALQKTQEPSVDKIWVSVFAADHGIAAESVSAFPQQVSAEMVRNFANSGAAINVLSRFVNADFEVVDVGLLEKLDLKNVVVARAGNGTANFAKQAAMTEEQMHSALLAGRHAVKRAINQQAQLFIGGEMGIANTTSASAMAVALTGLSVEQLAGAGTGVDSSTIAHKGRVIQQAVDLHQGFLTEPLSVLQYLGGFEIAALVGAYIYAAQQGLAVLIDGFIATVAALVAVKINAGLKPWLFYAHCSQEKGHRLLLEYLQVKPLLDLDLRLGEGSGAVAAAPLLQMACRLHKQMATFEQAAVHNKIS